ncbi:MAG: response regulator [Nitrospiraceae bacterium]
METRTQAQVLVVNDDPDIVTTVKDLLEHEGYAVDTAGTGAAAIDRIRAAHFHTVILDLGLPDRDGLSVLHTIRDYDPHVPVVIWTAFANSTETIHTRFHEAFAHRTKPYHRTEFRTTVARALTTQSASARTRQLEWALAESEQRFRALVESAPDAIVVHAADGRLQSWNRATLGIFGYVDDKMRGRSYTLLFAAPSQHAYARAVQHLAAGPPNPTFPHSTSRPRRTHLTEYVKVENHSHSTPPSPAGTQTDSADTAPSFATDPPGYERESSMHDPATPYRHRCPRGHTHDPTTAVQDSMRSPAPRARHRLQGPRFEDMGLPAMPLTWVDVA